MYMSPNPNSSLLSLLSLKPGLFFFLCYQLIFVLSNSFLSGFQIIIKNIFFSQSADKFQV